MKKTFKKAGVAVLSMAMLLSMGALAMPAGAAALPAGSKITLNGAQGKYCVYKVASSSKDATTQTVTYDIESAFGDVLKVEDGFVKTAQGGKKLSELVSNSADIEAVANALMEKAPAAADKVVSIEGSNTSVDIELSEAGLGSGYYLILGTTSGKTQPILVDVVPGATADAVVSANVTAKHSEVPFIKAITEINNAHADDNQIGKDSDGNDGGTGIADIGGVVTYTLTTSFPNYDSDVTDIDPFTITDIPEDSLNVDFTSIKVSVAGVDVAQSSDIHKTYSLTEDVTAAGLGANYKENNGDKFVSTVTTDGKGFQVVFDDSYVLANGGKSVSVTFNATVKSDADLVGDNDPDNSNDNGATLSYSNNFFTGKGKVTYPTKQPNPNNPTGPDVDIPEDQPSKPQEDADHPKVIPDDAKVFCTLVTVNKEDTEGHALKGATFQLIDSNGAVIATLGEQKATTDTGAENPNYIDKFEFKGLGAGRYTLHESTAPAGYTKAADVVFTITAAKDAATGMFKDTCFTFAEGGRDFDGTLTVIDPPSQTLPGTGGIGTYLFTIGGAAIVLLAGVLFVFYMRKRKTEE